MKRLILALALSAATLNANAGFGVGGAGTAAGGSSAVLPFIGLVFGVFYLIRADQECRATPGCKPSMPAAKQDFGSKE